MIQLQFFIALFDHLSYLSYIPPGAMASLASNIAVFIKCDPGFIVFSSFLRIKNNNLVQQYYNTYILGT